MVLLHGFMKKTCNTPKQDINLAIARKKGTGTLSTLQKAAVVVGREIRLELV